MGSLWVLGLLAAAAGSGRLEGTLVDLTGRPVAGASVAVCREVLPFVYDQPTAVPTDAQGRFALANVPAGWVQLRWPRGFPAHTWQREVDVAAGQTVVLDLVTDAPPEPLPPLARLRLRVRRHDGTLAAGQRLDYRIEGTAPPRLVADNPVTRSVYNQLWPHTGSLSEHLCEERLVGSARLDAVGEWSLDVPPGEVKPALWLPVAGGGTHLVEGRLLRPGETWELTADLPAPRGTPTVAVPPAAPARRGQPARRGEVDRSAKVVRVRILGPDGRAWAGREVWLFCAGYGTPRTAHAVTDADGWVERRAPWSSVDKAVTFHLKVPGFADVSREVAEERGPTQRTSLRLGPPATVAHGQVVDQLGQPVARAWVFAASEPLHCFYWLFGACDIAGLLERFGSGNLLWTPEPGQARVGGQLAERIYSTQTDAAGCYTFDQLDGGQFAFFTLPRGARSAYVEHVALGAQPAQVPKLVVERLPHLVPTIADRAGLPRAGVPVCVALTRYGPNGSGTSDAEVLAVTNARGALPALDLSAWSSTFHLYVAGGATASHNSVEKPQPGERVSPVLTSDAPVPLTGTVRGADGQPLAGALLTVDTEQSSRSVWTGADGRYRFDGLLGAQAHLGVRANGAATQRWLVDLPHVAPFDLHVPAGRTLRLLVRDADDQPVEGAWLTWLPSTGDAQPAKAHFVFAQGGGEAVLLGAADAGVALRLNADDHHTALRCVTPPADGSPVKVRLNRERFGSLSGRVLSADGRPLAGAQVTATTAADSLLTPVPSPGLQALGGGLQRGSESGVSGADGTYRLARVLSGTVSVSAGYGGEAAPPVVVQVPPRGEATCTLTFAKHFVRGQVAGCSRVEVRRAQASAPPAVDWFDAEPYENESVEEGRCSLALTPGRYRVSGWTAAREDQPPWVSLRFELGELVVPGPPPRWRLPALSATRLPLHWAALPAAERCARLISLRGQDGLTAQANAEFGDDGRLEVVGLPPGRYRVCQEGEACGVFRCVNVVAGLNPVVELQPVGQPNVAGRLNGCPGLVDVVARGEAGGAVSRCERDGTFALRLAPGRYTLRFSFLRSGLNGTELQTMTREVTIGPGRQTLEWEWAPMPR